ncbi:MAG: acetate--CoA ligase family protein [Chloroflexota bacterium]
MHNIFYPKSIAIIGVSSKPTNLGRNIVANLIEFGFDGIVYAVGPSGGTIETRRIYRSVTDIPDHVDLAVILTPAKIVPGLLEECGEKGIKRVVVETAGFREYGEAGKELEQQMTRNAAKYDMRFVGPNCIGVMNMENGLCVPFPRLKRFVKRGDVSIVSQSGGVAMSALNLMANEGIGLNKFISVGNMLNIDAEDVIEYLIEDEGTRQIFLYLESMRNGRRLMEIAKRSPKPILAFKANIGHLSQSIASSHTASLSSDDSVVDAAFKQSDIIRVHDATSLANNLKVLKLPPMKGRRLAIISRSGGHAVIAADACELVGFDLADFPEPFLREVEKHFRASVIRLTNPLDLGDLFDLNVYAQIVERTLKVENVDGIVFLHTSFAEIEGDATRQLLERLMQLGSQYAKPVAFYLSSSAQEVNLLKQEYDFPIFTQVVETIRALEMSYDHHCFHERVAQTDQVVDLEVGKVEASEIVASAAAQKRDLLLSEAVSLLDHYGIPTVPDRIAESSDQAVEMAEELGYPVVIKVIADQLSHKSDVGGVQLNLRNGSAVAQAYDEMMSRLAAQYPDVPIDGVLVQPMISGGRELIVGGRQDESFGPIVLVGMGGIYVEILEEVAIRVAPITQQDAEEMINELKAAPILKGARGHRKSDIQAIIDTLLRISQLLVDFPQVQEIDINPLVAFPEGEGCLALDARVLL